MESFQQLIWWLFQSSAGGPSRVRIVRVLRAQPRNAQQLAETLGMDYTTIRHHLRVLRTNGMIEATGDRYGQVYFVAPNLESRWSILEAIASRERTGRKRR